MTDNGIPLPECNEELLALYSFTGGVPKYVEMLVENGCHGLMDVMVDFMVQPDSPFLTEGKNLLIQEFWKNSMEIIFSILASIANGKNTLTENGKPYGGI